MASAWHRLELLSDPERASCHLRTAPRLLFAPHNGAWLTLTYCPSLPIFSNSYFLLTQHPKDQKPALQAPKIERARDSWLAQAKVKEVLKYCESVYQVSAPAACARGTRCWVLTQRGAVPDEATPDEHGHRGPC